MARRASAERPRQPREAETGEKPRLEVIEGGKGKQEKAHEAAPSEPIREQLERGDVLREQVRELKKEFLEAKTPEERAGLVVSLEKIEGMLRRLNKEWEILASSTLPEPSKAVEQALREIKKTEESEVARSLREIREMEQPKKPQEAQEPLLWEELRPGWEKDAKAAAEAVSEEGTREEQALAAEIMETNALPPRAEREVEHEARKLMHDAERADREVQKLEEELQKHGVDTDELATSAVARYSLSFRTLLNRKLRDLVRRHEAAQERADFLRSEAQIAELAPRDPMRSVTANAELIREYANRRKARQRSDAAYERLVKRGSRLG